MDSHNPLDADAPPTLWPRYLAAALSGAALVLTAFMFGRADGGESVASPPSTITATTALAATTTSTTTTPTAPPTTIAATTTTIALRIEPIADIADLVAPSVVQIETKSGVGSGVLISEAGHILTAAHVVDVNDDTVAVRLHDGRSVEGVILGRHDDTDVAVVAIEADNLSFATLAIGETPRVGQQAIALGSPFGLDQTVTAGIVSGVDRLVDGISMVQTDAAINPGNSGGPLVDAEGRVIGINDMIFTRDGDTDGIGFAISIELATVVAYQIIAGQDVQLAYLGVSVSAERGDVPGASINRVSSGSPAADAELQRGDLILTIDGSPVSGSDMIRSRVIRRQPGDKIVLEIQRGDDITKVVVTLRASDE